MSQHDENATRYTWLPSHLEGMSALDFEFNGDGRKDQGIVK